VTQTPSRELTEALNNLRAWGERPGPATTDVQDSLVFKATVRRLAHLSGARYEDLVRALRSDEDGDVSYGRNRARAIVKVWDFLASTNAQRPLTIADFKPGDKVTCPSGLATGGEYAGIGGEGVVTVTREGIHGRGPSGATCAPAVQVRWPSGQTWWHWPTELVKTPGAIGIGARVTSPTRRALGTDWSRHIRTPETQGTVVGRREERTEGGINVRFAVNWDNDPDPRTHEGWWHNESELSLVGQPVVSSAGATTTPLRTVAGRPVPSHTFDQVVSLLRAGNKIQAIKVLREATSVGLKEAKDYVEGLDLGSIPTAPVVAPEPSIIALLRSRLAEGEILNHSEDRDLALALLTEPRFMAHVISGDAPRELVEAAEKLLRRESLYGRVTYEVLLGAYDEATGRVDAAKLREVERLRAEAQRLSERAAALEREARRVA
jgi:hypothetical protein